MHEAIERTGCTTHAHHKARRSSGALDRIVVISDDSVMSGGAAAMTLTGIRAMREREIPVTLITGDTGTNPDLARWGVDVVALGGQHILEGNRVRAALRGLYDPRMAQAISGWIGAHDTPGTVYHLHNWHKVLSPSAFGALRAVEHRLVLSTHDFFLVCPNGGYFDFQRGHACPLQPMSGACMLRACDKRHYAHKLWRLARHRVRQGLLDLRSTRATILAVHEAMVPLLIRGGIPAGAIEILRNPAIAWTRERVPAECNREILFVGRIERDKGIEVLARVAGRLGITLKAIGGGPPMAELASAHPQIELLGARPREEIGAIARGARLVVVPSLVHETFSLVALEAAQSGIPVVISELALMAREIAARGFGIPCRPQDEDDLARSIAELMGDDARIAEMSRRGVMWAAGLTLPPDTWGDRLLALYGRIAARQRRSVGASDSLT